MKIFRKNCQNILQRYKRYTGEKFVILDMYMETRFPKGATDATRSFRVMLWSC